MKRSLYSGFVVFVGDKPSSKNLYEFVPFVGTSSYKKLLGWIADLDLILSQVHIINSSNETQLIEDVWSYNDYVGDVAKIKYIALGKNASKKLKRFQLEHHVLPHPSGLNRKLNNKKLEKKLIKSCYKYLRSHV